MKKVPLFNLEAQNSNIADEIENAVIEVLRSGRYILGDTVERFENEAAEYTGTKYAVGCASCTDALLLALMAYDIKQGDEIITSPFTFFATAAAAARLGAKPVFVDIEPDTFNIDPEKIKKKISKKTKAIIPVHLYGHPADMDPIVDIAKENGIYVVEDNAQAFGSDYKGRRTGSIGDMGTASFYPTKNLGGCGDGGMITTDDARIAEKLRALRNHGEKERWVHTYLGINSRLDAVQAAICSVKLKYIDSWNEKRRENAGLYNELLRDVPIVRPVEKEGVRHVYNQYVIRVSDRREQLIEHLSKNGIGAFVYYRIPLSLQESLLYLGYKKGDFPNAEKAAAEVLSLPCGPEVTEDDVRYVVEKIKEFLIN